MTSRFIFSSGIINGKGVGKPLLVYDGEIVNLYNSVKVSPTLLDDFDFRCKLLKRVLYNYGNFNIWFNLQTKDNELLNANVKDFIEDTYNFIKTGKRKLDLSTWEVLLEETSLSEKDKTNVNIKKGLVMDIDYLIEWSKHPNGFYDMLKTTYLLFK